MKRKRQNNYQRPQVAEQLVEDVATVYLCAIGATIKNDAVA